jgi:protein TonB
MSPEPLAVSLLPLSSPETLLEVPDGPVEIEQRPAEPPRPPEMPSLPPRQEMPRAPRSSNPAEAPSPPADPVARTSAPKSIPAPPAPSASSASSATWEAELLAHLEKYRRYPAAARARREQGVAHVRFRMDREGHVLSAEIRRSSGSVALDRAALDTLRRAQPLPAIPADRPDPLELAVPIEFFIKR